LCDVHIVIDREEDVRCSVEVGQDFFEGEWVGRVHEHVRHAGAEEDDRCFGEAVEFFALDVSRGSC
jgi:hypothetical protein